MRLMLSDHNKQLITLTVIILRSFHCISINLFLIYIYLTQKRKEKQKECTEKNYSRIN